MTLFNFAFSDNGRHSQIWQSAFGFNRVTNIEKLLVPLFFRHGRTIIWREIAKNYHFHVCNWWFSQRFCFGKLESIVKTRSTSWWRNLMYNSVFCYSCHYIRSKGKGTFCQRPCSDM
jgi:hypothetical protein